MNSMKLVGIFLVLFAALDCTFATAQQIPAHLPSSRWPTIVPEPSRIILAQTSPRGPRVGDPFDPYAEARQRLVDTRIRSAGVTNQRVLDAIEQTPRHEFVPAVVRNQAYFDMALPIGSAQTISSPFIVASMTETLDPQDTDRVLEIGTGSGYQAAVLSPLVDEVYSIEIVEPLGLTARAVLDRLGYDNVFTKIGDGFKGWPEKAPFDKIIVTCSPESVPVPLVEQLREGGSMIIPVGERYQQTLYRMIKKDGELVRQPLRPTLFVPMTGTAEEGRHTLPDPEHPTLVNGNFETATATSVESSGAPSQTDQADLAVESEFVAGWYYGRQVRRVVEHGNAMARFENETPGLGSHLLQGIAIDGSLVSTIRLSARIRTHGIVKGPDTDAWPMLAISFYDASRRDLGMTTLGPYRGTQDWHTDGRVLRVPPTAKEAIVRIGLFGATGRVDFDDVVVEKIGR
ncbi:protein-L-isoaspartate(D-aspartate) O-methyltransferase [Allorhodopirellula heiligendammensis]|uniref:Protein-L-isoaspartate O-methyltransferase n=1 Tax=Allorhodopirellula heiligendammensis TaxID=2714739 RepID=A0A5C6BTB4_9BACT|nr:protein-L-isoaspartate(D-aspartate) O-methyltransferase [Allorhodopirellula heiligendammensis]TWU15258.1 Protein-L-isoaspartate O-methyltransferase [Allorhodopirellula heiligendammensis]